VTAARLNGESVILSPQSAFAGRVNVVIVCYREFAAVCQLVWLPLMYLQKFAQEWWAPVDAAFGSHASVQGIEACLETDFIDVWSAHSLSAERCGAVGA